MNIYNAIMKAADHIEANPRTFNFNETGIPHSCKSPGCALGWIGHFAGMNKENRFVGFSNVSKRLIGIEVESDTEFYNRMNVISGGFAWRYGAADCASALRLYAAKYHAPKLPDSVTAIFTQSIVHTKRQLEVMEAQP